MRVLYNHRCKQKWGLRRVESLRTFVMQPLVTTFPQALKWSSRELFATASWLAVSKFGDAPAKLHRKGGGRGGNKNVHVRSSTALHSLKRSFNQSPVAAGSHSQLSEGRWSPLFSSTTNHVTRKWWRICIPSKLLQREGCWSAAVKHLYYFPSRKASSSL